MMNEKTLGSVVDNWESNILSELTSNFDVPWKTTITSGSDLDLDYIANRSGKKVISPLVEHILGENEKLTAQNINKLAGIAFRKYNDNWSRVWYALSLAYNPIQNYNGDETSTDEETIEGANTNTVTNNGTQTNTGTVGVVGSNTNTGTVSIAGSINNTGTQTNQGSTEYKGSESDSGTKLNTGTQGNSSTIEYSGSESEDTTKENTGTQTNTEDTTDNTSYGFNNYKETTTYGKTTDDTLSLTNRKSEKTIDGSYDDTYTPTNYTKTTQDYSKSYTQNRVNAFNGGLVISDDSETLDGVGNGAGGAGGTPGSGSGNYNETKTVESGSYKNSRTYSNNYKETTTESGTEHHDIDLGGHDDLAITGSKSENKDRDSTVTREDDLTETIGVTKSFNNRTDTTSETRTDNLSEATSNTHSFTNREDATSNTRTDNLTETKSETTTNNLTEGKNETTTNNLTQTNNNTEQAQGTNESTRVFEHTSHREGNLGVTSTQDMLTQEIIFRQTYNFFDSIVLPDLDKVLCCGYFGVAHL